MKRDSRRLRLSSSHRFPLGEKPWQGGPPIKKSSSPLAHPEQFKQLSGFYFPEICSPKRYSRVVLLECETGSWIKIDEET